MASNIFIVNSATLKWQGNVYKIRAIPGGLSCTEEPTEITALDDTKRKWTRGAVKEFDRFAVTLMSEADVPGVGEAGSLAVVYNGNETDLSQWILASAIPSEIVTDGNRVTTWDCEFVKKGQGAMTPVYNP